MVVTRPAVARGLAAARLARPVPSSLLRRSLRPAFRRGYASGGDAHGAPSSDIPWLLGAIAVTVPGCYYLWPEASHGDASHGHGGHEEHHEEPQGAEADDQEDANSEAAPKEPESEAPAESEEKPQEESKDESKDESKEDSKDDSSDSEGKKEEKPSKPAKPDTTEPEKTSNKKVDGVQFKGKTSAGDENNEMHDTRKREPDSKGGFKKRIDSAYQKDLGAGEHYDEEGKPTGKTAAKPSGNPGAIDTKQAGLTTTATRHSTQIDQDPEKSKKGEGVPETAKSATTINPKRPQGSDSPEENK
ncbi:hypothetical protein C1H76_2871 [Elsinoe australis]|uniref:Uncharacterized protein n=1 Tax=Elsinoe australis TaxID=40998 RepID=A0A4U7B167_9PEZI|nr:hypothetical protein C1H76_2871 [Elsinoe australis]